MVAALTMSTPQPLRLSIENEGSLQRASDILHDAVFSQEWLRFNQEERRFEIRLWREESAVTRADRVLFVLRRTKVLRCQCVLTLFHVESTEIKTLDRLDHYNLFGLDYERRSRLLRFSTEGAIAITLQLSDINGNLV